MGSNVAVGARPTRVRVRESVGAPRPAGGRRRGLSETPTADVVLPCDVGPIRRARLRPSRGWGRAPSPGLRHPPPLVPTDSTVSTHRGGAGGPQGFPDRPETVFTSCPGLGPRRGIATTTRYDYARLDDEGGVSAVPDRRPPLHAAGPSATHSRRLTQGAVRARPSTGRPPRKARNASTPCSSNTGRTPRALPVLGPRPVACATSATEPVGVRPSAPRRCRRDRPRRHGGRGSSSSGRAELAWRLRPGHSPETVSYRSRCEANVAQPPPRSTRRRACPS